jgi:hypothetical protein
MIGGHDLQSPDTQIQTTKSGITSSPDIVFGMPRGDLAAPLTWLLTVNYQLSIQPSESGEYVCNGSRRTATEHDCDSSSQRFNGGNATRRVRGGKVVAGNTYLTRRRVTISVES